MKKEQEADVIGSRPGHARQERRRVSSADMVGADMELGRCQRAVCQGVELSALAFSTLEGTGPHG